MKYEEGQNPLEVLYGSNALDLVVSEIAILKNDSNIPFDGKFVSLGIDFIKLNATSIVEGNKKSCTLKSLVSESFFEASVYKYNGAGGVL